MVRINDSRGATWQERMASAEKSLANTIYILHTIEQADPDIFVVLEARTGQGPIAQLAGGNGPAGLIYLLAEMREDLAELVPGTAAAGRPAGPAGDRHPHRDGRACSGAMTGWPSPARSSGRAGQQRAPGRRSRRAARPARHYPAPWDAVVPLGTTAAAWCRFYDNGNEILFNDATHRRPYLTIFRERAGAMRTVNLFSVHFKPGVNAQTACRPAERHPGRAAGRASSPGGR